MSRTAVSSVRNKPARRGRKAAAGVAAAVAVLVVVGVLLLLRATCSDNVNVGATNVRPQAAEVILIPSQSIVTAGENLGIRLAGRNSKSYSFGGPDFLDARSAGGGWKAVWKLFPGICDRTNPGVLLTDPKDYPAGERVSFEAVAYYATGYVVKIPPVGPGIYRLRHTERNDSTDAKVELSTVLSVVAAR